ncbi:hypothetical protein [Bordetella bronchiseptica]|uniref:hypothetical protein n=1 Tax=Bordetella bronchiseptica TaxID=518 RepID=UPI000FD7F8E8|nr:hypothetical protein [Bordetella bronchiseptica]
MPASRLQRAATGVDRHLGGMGGGGRELQHMHELGERGGAGHGSLEHGISLQQTRKASGKSAILGIYTATKSG